LQILGFSFSKANKFCANRQGGSNLQDEFSTNCDFADFVGGPPDAPYSKSQLDAPIYWWSDSFEEHFFSALPIGQEIAY
jgi:hypothetical protein